MGTKEIIRKILKEGRIGIGRLSPVHGDSIPTKWIDGNTRGYFEADGVKYRAIYPWNHRNGRIGMQIIPYDKIDKAYYKEMEGIGPYAAEDWWENGKTYLWAEEPGNRVYNKLNNFIGSEHDWNVRKVEDDSENGKGFLIFVYMNVFELVEDYLHIADKGNPFDGI